MCRFCVVRMKSSFAISRCSHRGFQASVTSLSAQACGVTPLASAVRMIF
ncbi:hypothetical protein SVIOM342S_01412 [Streptomyces violaceorubidus]